MWQEEQDQNEFVVPDDVVDLLFAMRCPTLPLDHAQALADAIQQVLPWFADDPVAGLHTVHGADSGNGWERPEGEGDIIHLSRRTRLQLRLPKARLDAAKALEGVALDIAGHHMEVGDGRARLLSASTTLYARYVSMGDGEEDEVVFMQRAMDELRRRAVRFKKILCGKATRIATSKGPVLTRSLMVAQLPLEDTVRLQQEGLGQLRKLGCGLFIAHKSV